MNRPANEEKRVLLVGDVGRRDDGFYHIGDEAMVYQNYSLYRRAGDFEVNLFSWALTHDYMDAGEYHFWEMPIGREGWQRILRLVEQAEQRERFPSWRFPNELKDHLELLRKQDLVHISGGGNLNSYFPKQLYTSALIVLLAKVLGKPVLITGQTIGPLAEPTDRSVANRALDAANVITVRDRRVSIALLKELDVCRPQMHVALDDAFFLEGSPASTLEPFWLPSSPGRTPLRVGVSVHSRDVGARLQGILASSLNDLARRVPIEVYFIPHIIVTDDTKHDVPFMRGISARLDAEVPQRVISCQDLTENREPAKERLVKALTGAMDIVIATRYHALVFAIGSGVPALALNEKEYNRAKSLGLLQMVFEDRAEDYALDMPRASSGDLVDKLSRLIEHRVRIRETLLERRLAWSGRADLNLKLARELLGVEPRAPRGE